VLDAAFDAKHSIPGEVEIRFKRKTVQTPVPGTARKSLVTEVPIADGTPIQDVDDVLERRRRNSFSIVAEGTPSQVTPLPLTVERDPRDDSALIHSPTRARLETAAKPAPPEMLREASTAELAPEVLDSLARKSARMDATPAPPQKVEALRTEVSIQPISDESAPVEKVEPPRQMSPKVAFLLGLGFALAVVLGFLAMQYL